MYPHSYVLQFPSPSLGCLTGEMTQNEVDTCANIFQFDPEVLHNGCVVSHSIEQDKPAEKPSREDIRKMSLHDLKSLAVANKIRAKSKTKKDLIPIMIAHLYPVTTLVNNKGPDIAGYMSSDDEDSTVTGTSGNGADVRHDDVESTVDDALGSLPVEQPPIQPRPSSLEVSG